MSLLEPPQQFLTLLRESLPDAADGFVPAAVENDVSGKEEILAYVAFLAAGLCDAQEFTPEAWVEALKPYLEQLPEEGRESDPIIEKFRHAAEKVIMGEDDVESYGDEEDEGFEEVCNLRFNLAYGGKILLHQTKMRLLRGRRYALVGQNGVGKTTLMSAINNGKLEGWPQHLKTAYVDSGSNVDPAYEAQYVMKHLMDSTGRSKADCLSRLDELEFTDTMKTGTIGALSGGWQMKLRLIRAILMEPDIYLLDEPTNHLAEGAVKTVSYPELDLGHGPPATDLNTEWPVAEHLVG